MDLKDIVNKVKFKLANSSSERGLGKMVENWEKTKAKLEDKLKKLGPSPSEYSKEYPKWKKEHDLTKLNLKVLQEDLHKLVDKLDSKHLEDRIKKKNF